jgi:hypothetical protein
MPNNVIVWRPCRYFFHIPGASFHQRNVVFDAGGCAANYTHPMFEPEDIEDPEYIGTSLQRQFSKSLAEMLKGGSSSDTEAMQV